MTGTTPQTEETQSTQDAAPSSPEELIASSSTEDLFNALGSSHTEEQEEDAAQEQAEQPEDEAGEDAEDEPSEPTEDAPKAKKHPQYRLKPSDDQENAFYSLLKSGKSAIEAAKAVYGDVLTQKKDEQKPDEVNGDKPESTTVATEYDTRIAEHQTAIKSLIDKQREAIEDADLAEVSRTSLEIARLERRIEREEDRKEAAIAKQAEQQERETTSRAVSQAEAIAIADRDKAVERFPELGDPNSDVRKAFEQFVESARESDDYKDINFNGAWRVRLANEFAVENGLVPASKRKASPPSKSEKPSFTPAQTKQAIKPRAGAARIISSKEAPNGGANAPTITEADISKMSLDDLTSILSKIK